MVDPASYLQLPRRKNHSGNMLPPDTSYENLTIDEARNHPQTILIVWGG